MSLLDTAIENTATINGQFVGQVGARVANISKGGMRDDLSHQWYGRPDDQRFTSLTSLYDYTKDLADRSYEIRLNNKDFEMIAPDIETQADTHKLAVTDGEFTGQLTHYSFGQMAALAGAPAGYLRTLPSQLVADNMNYGIKFNRKTEAVKAFAMHGDHGPAMLRAVTGPDYGRIPDYEVVKAVQNIAGDGTGDTHWKIPGKMNWSNMVYNPHVDITTQNTTLFASDRDVFMFLVDDTHPIQVGTFTDSNGVSQPDYLFRGFYVWNSEVGSKTMGVAAFYLRSICCNRMMWGVEGFQQIKLRHSKHAPDRFLREASPALKSFADGSEQRLIEGVKMAKQAVVAQNDDDALEFLQKRKFSKFAARGIFDLVEREEGHKPRTAWDMAQGVTAHARRMPNTDERVKVELVGSKILNQVANAS